MTAGIEKGLETLNPFRKTEAETIAFSEGMKASQNEKVGVFVNAMKDGAYIKVRDVDFREGGASRSQLVWQRRTTRRDDGSTCRRS